MNTFEWMARRFVRRLLAGCALAVPAALLLGGCRDPARPPDVRACFTVFTRGLFEFSEAGSETFTP